MSQELTSRFGALVTAIVIAVAASAASAAPMIREGGFRAPMIQHARLIPNKPPPCYGAGCGGPGAILPVPNPPPPVSWPPPGQGCPLAPLPCH
jgi:hypothetical protein